MKNKQVLIFVFILLLVLTGNYSFRLFAQSLPPIHSTHYTTDDGLPHDIGYQILQDKEGYLWVGTDNGLARFDGYQFRTFDDEDGLTNPFIIDLSISDENDLYIGTWGNGVFKRTKDTIFHIPMHLMDLKISRIRYHDEIIKSWTRSSLTVIGFKAFSQWNFDLQTKQLQRVFYFGKKGGEYNKATLIKSEEINNSIANYSHVDGNLRGKVFHDISPAIKLRNKQEVYLTELGLLKDDPNADLVKSDSLRISFPGYYEDLTYISDTKSLIPFDKRLEGIVISTLAEDQDGNFWLGSKGKIHHLTASGKLSSYPCTSSDVTPYELTIWQNKYVVFFTHEDRSKLYLMEMKNRRIHELGTHLELSATVSDIYIDDEDNLWMTTDGAGLYCLRPFLTRNYAKEEGLENSFIYEVVETNDGTLFAATKEGAFYFKGKNWIKLDNHNINVDLRSGFVISEDGHIWLGGGPTYAELLTEIQIPSLQVANIDQDQVGRNFYVDSKNRIWSMEVMDHCLRYYQKNRLDDLKQFFKKGGWGAGFSESFLESFFAIQEIHHDQFSALETNNKNMLLGTSRGLFVIDGDHFEHYSKENGLPSTVINDIVKSEDGRVWIATEKGICIREGERFLPVSTEGLMSVQCRKLLFDHKGQLWTGTPSGLHYFIPSEEIWIPITKNMGLIANDITSLFEDSQKRLWIGTSRGVSMLPNEEAPKRLSPPSISIEKILLNNQVYRPSSQDKRIPFRSTVRIDFAAITFQSAKELLFQYRLNKNEAWQVTNNRSVVFSDLADGNYHFQIRSKKPNSNWSESENFTFSVKPPWYRSLWFLLIASLGLFALGRLLFVQRIRLVRKKIETKSKIKEDLAQLEMKALQAQMNPHFIFNAMNSIMDFVMNEDKYAANQYLAKFARLMRLFLDASKSNYISLAEELEMITLYVELEKLRFRDKFDFKISYNDEIPIDILEIPSMLVQPFIENAIHHGLSLKEEKGQLEMRIEMIGQELKIEIEDNGVGRDAALKAKKQSLKSYKSRGTQIVQEKIALLNSRQDEHFSVNTIDLKDATGRPIGTRVCINISIQD